MQSFELPPASSIKVWRLFVMTLPCIIVAAKGPCSATHHLQHGALLALHCQCYNGLPLYLFLLCLAGEQTHFVSDYIKTTVGTLGSEACMIALSHLCELGLND